MEWTFEKRSWRGKRETTKTRVKNGVSTGSNSGPGIGRTGGPCLALDEVLSLDHSSWQGGPLRLLLMRVVQLG